MLRSRPVRRSGFASSFAIGAALCGVAVAQTRLPGTLPPTSPTSAQVTSVNATAAPPDAAKRAHRAEVQYASGLLSINANNSSLNQILRDISRQTGMKITGGVRDERVFGHYGPASPQDILAMLIDPNATNMVLRETASNSPAELILTPRGGGPTPPNPNAPGFNAPGSAEEDDNAPPPQQPTPQQISGAQQSNPQNQQTPPSSGPRSIPQPANNVNGSVSNTSPTASTMPVTSSVPIDSIPTPSTTPPTSGIVDAPNPPDSGTVNPVTTNPPVDPNPPAPADGTTPDPNSPNGVKTPEQIFQQLQQLQQQRQQKAAPSQ